MKLYKLFEANDATFSDRIALQDSADRLIGIAFSLWRAVFLSDLTGDAVDQLADAKRFLRALIAHNSVLYQTDFAAREWSFRYYLDNAISQLMSLPIAFRPPAPIAAASGAAKDQWTKAQTALEAAISQFAEIVVGDHGPS